MFVWGYDAEAREISRKVKRAPVILRVLKTHQPAKAITYRDEMSAASKGDPDILPSHSVKSPARPALFWRERILALQGPDTYETEGMAESPHPGRL